MKITLETTIGELMLELDQLGASIALDREQREDGGDTTTHVVMTASAPSVTGAEVRLTKLRMSKDAADALDQAVGDLREDLGARYANLRRLDADRDLKPGNLISVAGAAS